MLSDAVYHFSPALAARGCIFCFLFSGGEVEIQEHPPQTKALLHAGSHPTLQLSSFSSLLCIDFPGGLCFLSPCSSYKLLQNHPVYSLLPVSVFLRISYYRICCSWHPLPVTPAAIELNLFHGLAMNCSLKSITKLCMILEFRRSWGQQLGMVDPATLSVMTGWKFQGRKITGRSQFGRKVAIA